MSSLDYEPAVLMYVLLAVGGFVIGVFGNIVGSRILIGTGILLIYAGVLFLPMYGYLSR